MDNASALPEMQATAPPESHYDLYLRAGRSIGLYFRNTNHGVTLTPGRINWTFDGKADGAPFQNIRSVHLQTGGDWRDPTNICTITFADGYKLVATATGRQAHDATCRTLRLVVAGGSVVFASGPDAAASNAAAVNRTCWNQ